MAQPTYTRAQFAAKIKEKYPQYAEVDDNKLVDSILEKYPTYADQIDEGKMEEPQMEDATAVPVDMASNLEDSSSEPQLTQEEHNERAKHIQDAAFSMVSQVPEFMRSPMMSFVSTVAETGAGFVGGLEKLAYRRAQDLVEQGKVDGQGKVFTDEVLNQMSPAEKVEVFENWSLLADDIKDKIEPLSQGVEQHGTGSIYEELLRGNIGNAAAITADQTAAGLASLIPFAVPGGAVLGPAILGVSAGDQEFEENIQREDATMRQIYNASYATAGNEFAWELVTGKILGRAKKMAAGGASAQAVKEFTKKAWQRVLGAGKSEGFSEGMTDFGSRLIDNYFFDDEIKAREAFVGFVDAAIVGSIVGGKVATYGELASPGSVHQRVAAKSLQTEEQKAESAERAKKAAEAASTIKRLEGTDLEGSLVEKAELEAAQETLEDTIKEEKAAEDKHIETLNDMTATELKEYAENLDKAKKLEQQKKKIERENQKLAETNPDGEPQDTTVIDEAIHKARLKAMTAYNTVANWRETTAAIDQTIKNNKDKIKEIEQEEGNIKLEEKQASKAEQPNPVGTRKRKQRAKKLQQEKVKVQKNIDTLEKIKDEARPTTADAKTRKRRAKKKPAPLPESATKPIKDAAQRSDANEDLAAILADPEIPSTQKERALNQVFKVNAPLIGQIAGNLAAKNNRNRKEVETLLKSEVGRRVTETGKIDKNTWNTAQQAVARLLKQERETVKRKTQRSGELKAELRDIDQQVLDGILDPEAAEIIKDDIRREYGEGEGGTVGITTTTAEGDTQIRSDVEKATRKDSEKKDTAELAAKLMAGRSVEELFKDIPGNSETIFALLPPSATNRRAFSGIFADGNPAVEIWESYFDKSDGSGRTRISRLKKAVNEALGDLETDSDSTTQDDIMEGAFDFLERDKFSPTRINLKEAAALIGKLKRSFPGVRVIISRAKMAERLYESGQDSAAQSALDGRIKGFVTPDRSIIYINELSLDAETPIHEFGHLWAQAVRKLRPDLYMRGLELLRDHPIWKEVHDKAKNPKSVYHGLDETQLAEEVMAHAIGRYGDIAFTQVEKFDGPAWQSYVKNVFGWIQQQLGIQKPFADMKLGEFLNIAVTEMMTGKEVIEPIDTVRMNKSFLTQFLEVPSGSTRDYTPSSKPITEFDTHGVFKGQALKKELYTALNRYWDDIQQGGWIGYTTGSYGDAVVGTPKFNQQLNAKIEAKVKVAKELVEGEGLQFKRDPRNPGFHIISKPAPISSFLETPKQVTAAGLQKTIEKAIKNALKPYKTPSPFKYSRIDEETRNVLKATLADLQGRDSVPLEVLQKLYPTVVEAIKTGRANRKAQKELFDERKKTAREAAASFVKNSSKVDPDKITKTEANRLAKKKDSWLTRQGLANKLSNILAPATNNDFYGLMYNLLPEGKLRETARTVMDNLLLKPLEKANIDYLNAKGKLRENWVNAKVFAVTQQKGLSQKQIDKALEKMNNLLNAESNIEFAGAKLRNYDLVKVYNYMKDPSTYRPLENTLDNDTLDAIVDAVNSDETLKRFADIVPGVYAGVAGQINAKLASHGRETFGKNKIDKESLTPEQKERLEKIYGGEIPNFAVYTPLTSEGAETDADVDKLISQDNYAMYTVMDGRLKKRTGGGEVLLHSNNLDGDFDLYLNGPVRTMAFLDFAKNASDFFGPKQMTAMRAAYGDQWAGAVKDSLRRIVTGKNQPSKQTAATRALDKWINRTVGTVMAVNVRSAVLQLISIGNFAVNDPKSFFSGLSATRAEKDFVRDFLKNSEWSKERGKGKVDLAVDAIFDGDQQNFVDTVLQKGYVLTKLGDKFAITVGGAPYMIGKYRQYQKEGLSQEDAIQKAYADFVAQAEETQQSTRPERLGQTQTTPTGKLILAFANTPMQYNRKMLRAIKDLRASGTNPQRKRQAARELIYYGALQNMVFTTLQKLIVPGVDDDEEKTTDWINSLANTLLRGIGVWGAVVAAAKDALIAASKGKDVYDPLINVAPAIGTKVRHIRTALGTKKIYAQSNLIDDPEIYQIASGINAVTNLPADRAIKVVEQVADAFESDLNWYQKVLRALGWSRYDLGVPASQSPLNKLASPFPRLNKGEDGQAHKDGTIEVDPDLSPEEKAKTIAHEKQHIRDMDAGILDYDDNNVYYHGTPFERKDGKINYHGEWYEEGHPELPWEKRAYEAESPLNKNGDDKRYRKKIQEREARAREKHGPDAYLDPNYLDYKRKRTLFELPYPEDDAYATQAKDWYTNWEFDPETEKRWAASETGVDPNRVGQAVHRAQVTPLVVDDEGVESKGLYVPYSDRAAVSSSAGVDTGVHELTHAGGLDAPRGAHALDIIGPLKVTDTFGNTVEGTTEYVSNPQEVGAFMMQLRHQLNLKPGQEVTKEMLDTIDTRGEEVPNMLLRAARDSDKEDKLIEAMNTVAAVEPRRNDNTALARLKSLYSKYWT